MKVEVSDLIGVSEIALIAGVTSPAVSNWIARGIFPAPAHTLRGGSLWLWRDVVLWLVDTDRLSIDGLRSLIAKLQTYVDEAERRGR
jgi:hypothetical protein